MTLTPLQLYRIKRTPTHHTSMSATHIPSVHNYNISHHNNTPMIHVFPSFPMHSFLHVSHYMSFSFHLAYMAHQYSPCDFSLSWSDVVPNPGFSKKCPYWMVLMVVYMETAEGLLKPLFILPAAVMPFTPFILIFSWRHHPLCSCWFIPFSQPTSTPFPLFIIPTLVISLCPLSFLLSYWIREWFL